MKITIAVLVCALGAVMALSAQDTQVPFEFFPMKMGTYWVYEGTVSWHDPEKAEPASAKVSWRMTVDKVIRREGLVAAVVSGFPADLDWSNGNVEPKPWLILEDAKHRVHYVNMGPDFEVSKYERGNQSFDKFLAQENLLFEWPLKEGAKFCDEEAKKREDGFYCWNVEEESKRTLQRVKGAPKGEQTVFRLHYWTNPDDESMELVQGVGLISYRYHHHGTVADTELQLVEFHPGTDGAKEQGIKP